MCNARRAALDEVTAVNRQQVTRILSAISLTSERELTCAGLNEERLAAYADLELASGDPATRMPDVYRHLALCPDCRRDYQDVLRMLRLAQTEEWIEPAAKPALDLSFLPTETSGPVPWVDIAERVRRYARELPVLLLHELERLGELPASLQLRPAAGAPAKLRGPETDTPVVFFRLTDAGERFAVDLRFRRAGEDVVWIGIQPLEVKSEAPLRGAIVGLHEGDGRLLEMRTVPSDGAVQLRDVPIDREFLLRVEHEGNAWEIPFSLRLEMPGEER